jgi:hypothetical protein
VHPFPSSHSPPSSGERAHLAVFRVKSE